MYWIAARADPSTTPATLWWCLLDNDGGEQRFHTKDEARRALLQIAEGETDS
jgi:hypothetical protein